MFSVFSLDRDLNAEEENKVSFVQGELVTKAGLSLWEAETVFFLPAFGFPAGKAAGGMGWDVPRDEGSLEVFAPPKSTQRNQPCPQHPAKHPKQQADKVRTSRLLLFSSHSCIFLEDRKKFLGWALGQGVSIPESAQKMFGCGTACSIPGKIPSFITKILFPFYWQLIFHFFLMILLISPN